MLLLFTFFFFLLPSLSLSLSQACFTFSPSLHALPSSNVGISISQWIYIQLRQIRTPTFNLQYKTVRQKTLWIKWKTKNKKKTEWKSPFNRNFTFIMYNTKIFSYRSSHVSHSCSFLSYQDVDKVNSAGHTSNKNVQI